jgi:alpha-L-fucosidase
MYNTLFDKKRNYKPEKYPLLSEEKMQWFRDAKFGLFIHWGLYSITEQGEWEMFNHRHNVSEYARLADEFHPEEFNAGEWVQMAKDAGMKYMVLTTRHHDGFCLFDSKVSDFTSMKTSAGRDFVREYVDACRAAGLKVGLYYSPMDWRFPGYFFPEMYYDNALEMKRQCEAQLEELLTNYGKIDLLWFDGAWLAHGGTAWESRRNPEFTKEELFLDCNYFWDSERMANKMRQWQPDMMFNDRFCIEGDFTVRERSIGGIRTDKPWDSNDCLAKSWGYDPDLPMFTLRECIQNLVKTVVRDGNYLLNLGPMKTGKFDPEHAERILQVGQWLQEYGDTIYKTRGGPVLPGDWGGAVYRNNLVYLHILDWQRDTLEITLPNGNVTAARNLTGGHVNFHVRGQQVQIQVPIKDRNLYDTIVELELDVPVQWDGAAEETKEMYGLKDGL